MEEGGDRGGLETRVALSMKSTRWRDIIDLQFLTEFTNKEFERQGKGIWNYLKLHFP